MKMFVYIFAVLVCAVTVANCIVCPPNYCAGISCQAVSESECESSHGIYEANGGFCGCCPTCLTKLARGANCAVLGLRGSPPTAACEDGTTCQALADEKTFVCQ